MKIPEGCDDVSGWSDLVYVDGKYQSVIAYGKYYTVNFYDYDRTTLLASMKLAVGSDNVGPDMSGVKDFKCWSIPLSEVNENCSVYAVRKQENVSVSASEAILSAASYNKVASDATYSAYTGYYSVTATATNTFVAGEVYTATSDGYALALSDTGDTYYTLSVTPVVATAETLLTNYYTYTYTMADESPIKTVGSVYQNAYTPKTDTTSDVIFLSGDAPYASTFESYVTVKVYADYSGLYKIDYMTGSLSKTYYHYHMIRNVTTAEENPNVEAFMTNHWAGSRGTTSSNKTTANKASFLYDNATATMKETIAGYLYLAEGWNTIKMVNGKNGNNSTGVAIDSVRFTLRHESSDDSVVLRANAGANLNVDPYMQGAAVGHDRVEASAVGKTYTRTLTFKAGTYQIYTFGLARGTTTLTYTFTNAEGVSVVTHPSAVAASEINGNTYGAPLEIKGDTVTIPEDGTYTVTAELTELSVLIDYYLTEFVPVTSTVTFVDSDNTVLSKQTVINGGVATAPDMSGDEGFLYWNTDFSEITGDLTVTAVRRHTVTFRTYDGKKIDVRTTVTGGSVTAPEAPERDGYLFTGWSKDIENV